VRLLGNCRTHEVQSSEHGPEKSLGRVVFLLCGAEYRLTHLTPATGVPHLNRCFPDFRSMRWFVTASALLRSSMPFAAWRRTGGGVRGSDPCDPNSPSRRRRVFFGVAGGLVDRTSESENTRKRPRRRRLRWHARPLFKLMKLILLYHHTPRQTPVLLPLCRCTRLSPRRDSADARATAGCCRLCSSLRACEPSWG